MPVGATFLIDLPCIFEPGPNAQTHVLDLDVSLSQAGFRHLVHRLENMSRVFQSALLHGTHGQEQPAPEDHRRAPVQLLGSDDYLHLFHGVVPSLAGLQMIQAIMKQKS